MAGIPSGFLPSAASRVITYDSEGRLLEYERSEGRLVPVHPASREEPAGVAEANSLYATDAEMFGSLPPFLRANRDRDIRRRNYIIQPGGAQIIFSGPPPVATLPTRRAYAPSSSESMGHNSYDGTKLAGPVGRTITARG